MTAFPFDTILIDEKTCNRFVVKSRSDVGGERSLFLAGDNDTIKRGKIVCEYARQLTFMDLDEYNQIAKPNRLLVVMLFSTQKLLLPFLQTWIWK